MEIVEIGGYWVVAHKCRYDDEKERTILGAGPTKADALEQALRHTVEVQDKLERVTERIAEALNADTDIEGLGVYVEVPGVILEMPGHQPESKVGAIYWDEEDKVWLWSFR